MKKLLLISTALIISLSISAQDLKSIMEKYEKASGTEKLKSFKTLVVEGNISQMGMSMNFKMLEKRPDKLKTSIEFSGMEMISVINGDKGYMVNPTLSDQFKAGNAEYLGEGSIGGKASYKVKTTTDAGDAITYIDKSTYLVNGLTMSVTQMGQTMDVELRMGEYKELNGVKMATKIDTYVQGTLSGTMNLAKIEFDTQVDDALFQIK